MVLPVSVLTKICILAPFTSAASLLKGGEKKKKKRDKRNRNPPRHYVTTGASSPPPLPPPCAPRTAHAPALSATSRYHRPGVGRAWYGPTAPGPTPRPRDRLHGPGTGPLSPLAGRIRPGKAQVALPSPPPGQREELAREPADRQPRAEGRNGARGEPQGKAG
ncbi:uncharacterized protein ACIBXB_020029 [Morphnus guianensis]